jgi:hypothetical protein
MTTSISPAARRAQNPAVYDEGIQLSRRDELEKNARGERISTEAL